MKPAHTPRPPAPPSAIDVADLMTLAIDDCYELTRRVLAKVGVVIPESPQDLLAGPVRGRELPAGETARAGDVVVIRGHGSQHLGVMTGPVHVVHNSLGTGVCLTPLGAFRRLGIVERIVRPLELIA